MNKIPVDRLFTKEHEWVKIEGDQALVGITHYAQSSLGDVVYVELPQVGSRVTRGKAIGVVESVKAVSDIYAPLSGTVKQINPDVLKEPERINLDPYGQGWLMVIEMDEQMDSSLLNDKGYGELLEKEAKC